LGEGHKGHEVKRVSESSCVSPKKKIWSNLIMCVYTLALWSRGLERGYSVNFKTWQITSQHFLITSISSLGWLIKKSGFCLAKASGELKPQVTAITLILAFFEASISLVSSPT
jgi:hypothetical protein